MLRIDLDLAEIKEFGNYSATDANRLQVLELAFESPNFARPDDGWNDDEHESRCVAELRELEAAQCRTGSKAVDGRRLMARRPLRSGRKLPDRQEFGRREPGQDGDEEPG